MITELIGGTVKKFSISVEKIGFSKREMFSRSRQLANGLANNLGRAYHSSCSTACQGLPKADPMSGV